MSNKPQAETLPELLGLLIANIRDYAIFLLDAEGHVITWNRGAELINGYRAEEILGRHLSVFYTPEEIAEGKPQHELVVAAGDGRFEDEGWRVRRDGTKFWANVVVTGLKNSKGELLGFAKVTRDLTERRQVEEALKRSEARLNEAQRIAHVGSWTWDVESNTVTWSDEMFRVYGLRPGQFAATYEAFLERVLPEDRPISSDVIGRALKEGRDFEYEHRIILPTGEIRTVHARGRVVCDASGRVVQMSGTGQDVTERKKNEQVLAEREQSLDTLLDSIGEGVIACDVEGRVTRMNPVAERLTGWRESEGSGRPVPEVLSLVSEDTRMPAPSAVLATLRDGSTVSVVEPMLVLARGGSERPVAYSAAPIRDLVGRLTGAVLVIRDRSVERTAEQMRMQLVREQTTWTAAQAQRDRMYSLFMQAPAAIAVLRGPEFVFELSNPMNDKLAGRPLTGLPARNAFPELDAAGIVAQLQRVYRTGVPFVANEMPVPGSPDGGSDIFVNGALQPFRGTSGDVEGVMVVAFDVSKQVIARKRTEALGAVTSALAQAITTADVAEVVATQGRQTVEADACAVFLADEENGRLLLRAHHGLPEEVARELGSTENAATPASVTLHARAPVWIETVEEYRKRFPLAADGLREDDPFHSLFFFPLLGPEKAVGVVCMGFRESRHFGHDDRQFIETLGAQYTLALHRARLHGELQRAVAVRDDFLSIASHELNTPLTSLKLQVANMQRRLLSGEQMENKLSILERLTDRMATLVGELLDVSRIQTGSLALDREDAVDLGEIVREVIDEMEGELRRTGSELALENGVPAVGRWDRARLAQVVRNLLSNAVKFGRGRPILVTIAALPREARLEVKDGGIGIAAQDLERIFDRFERAVSTRHFGGFGLGLWIVNRIVQSLGGTIAVESVPGRGSTFTVTLPYG